MGSMPDLPIALQHRAHESDVPLRADQVVERMYGAVSVPKRIVGIIIAFRAAVDLLVPAPVAAVHVRDQVRDHHRMVQGRVEDPGLSLRTEGGLDRGEGRLPFEGGSPRDVAERLAAQLGVQVGARRFAADRGHADAYLQGLLTGYGDMEPCHPLCRLAGREGLPVRPAGRDHDGLGKLGAEVPHVVADKAVRAPEPLYVMAVCATDVGLVDSAVIAVQHVEDQPRTLLRALETETVEGAALACSHLAMDRLFVERDGVVSRSGGLALVAVMGPVARLLRRAWIKNRISADRHQQQVAHVRRSGAAHVRLGEAQDESSS